MGAPPVLLTFCFFNPSPRVTALLSLPLPVPRCPSYPPELGRCCSSPPDAPAARRSLVNAGQNSFPFHLPPDFKLCRRQRFLSWTPLTSAVAPASLLWIDSDGSCFPFCISGDGHAGLDGPRDPSPPWLFGSLLFVRSGFTNVLS